MFRKTAWLWGIIFLIGFGVSLPAEAGTEEGITALEQDDYETAFREFTNAAEAGDPEAQYRLGAMYELGWGVTQSDSEAARWYRQAAEQGNVNAQFDLGAMYDGGRGVPQNYKEAIKWYRLAAEQGRADAQYRLGFRYQLGQGVEANIVQASMWFSVARNTARSNLWLETLGKDTRSKIEVQEIVIKALRVGEIECTFFDILASMTPQQKAESVRLQREWMEKHNESAKQGE